MGCICSSGEIQDISPHIFYVTNIDSEGNAVKSGRLEITPSQLIFHEDDAPSIQWPLRCLRRYGWDSGTFSFESGRRAPTGVGIFAFKSPRAQEIFNLLQARFAAEETLASTQNSSSNCAIFGPRGRQASTIDGYLEPIAPRLVPRFRVTSTSPNGGARVRLDSVDSCSETQSPSSSTSSPPTAVDNTRSEGPTAGFKQLWDSSEQRPDVEKNNNGHQYSNGVISNSGLRLLDSFPLALDVNRLVDTDNSHVYMNIAPGTEPMALVVNPVASAQCFTPTLSNLVITEESSNEPQHCYTNLELPEIEVPQPNGVVNYAVLDLEQAVNTDSPMNNLSPTETPCIVPPDSPMAQGPPPPSGYVTIDFQKTKALKTTAQSHSVLDREVKRKSRQNSTPGQLPPG